MASPITDLSNGEDEQSVENNENTAGRYVDEHDTETVVDVVVEVNVVHDEWSLQRHAAFHLDVSVHQRRHHSGSAQQLFPLPQSLDQYELTRQPRALFLSLRIENLKK